MFPVLNFSLFFVVVGELFPFVYNFISKSDEKMFNRKADKVIDYLNSV